MPVHGHCRHLQLIYLVTMIRADKDIMEFYFQALRKKKKRKTKAGVGITILNTRMYTKGFGVRCCR